MPPSRAYRVTAPIFHPVRANVGDYVLVRPGTKMELLVIRAAEPSADFAALGAHLATGALAACPALGALPS
jgi:hypothetical protein